ncbi:hypothetical protein TNCV_4552921 [Trichonephila clavipes]|nr:hypothetical protein TNCV_4552921 [Trichonephila clavipes]
MPNHRMFPRLHRQLRETHSFHVTKHDAGRLRAVLNSRLEENIVSIVAVSPESSTRAHHYTKGIRNYNKKSSGKPDSSAAWISLFSERFFPVVGGAEREVSQTLILEVVTFDKLLQFVG